MEYQTNYNVVADTETFTISGRPNRTVTLVHLLVNGTGVETVDATIVYNTAAGDAVVCKPLTQVTAASGVPTQLDFNDQDTETFPIAISEGESLVFTCTSSAAGDMTFASSLKIKK